MCYSEEQLERSLTDALSTSCAHTAAVSAQRVNAHNVANASDEHGIEAVSACRREHETVLRKVYDEDYRLWEGNCARAGMAKAVQVAESIARV